MVLRYWFCGRVFRFRSLLLRLLMQGSSEVPIRMGPFGLVCHDLKKTQVNEKTVHCSPFAGTLR